MRYLLLFILAIATCIAALAGVSQADMNPQGSSGSGFCDSSIMPCDGLAGAIGGEPQTPLVFPEAAATLNATHLSAPEAVVGLDPTHLVASVHTRGQYDNAGLGTWNGQPLSQDNQPTFDENQLSADWNFYVNPDAPNELFLEVTNVADTKWGSVFGSPFAFVALTGFTFRLTPVSGIPPLSSPGFSNNFARPGEVLDGRPSQSAPPVQVPLASTPGWAFSELQPDEYTVSTLDVQWAFSHFQNIHGTTRIVGGGLFKLVFASSVDLLFDVDFRLLTAEASHGLGMYAAPGQVTFAVAPLPVAPLGITYTFTTQLPLGTAYGTGSFTFDQSLIAPPFPKTVTNSDLTAFSYSDPAAGSFTLADLGSLNFTLGTTPTTSSFAFIVQSADGLRSLTGGVVDASDVGGLSTSNSFAPAGTLTHPYLRFPVLAARGCGLGIELAPLLPGLLWLRGRRRRSLA